MEKITAAKDTLSMQGSNNWRNNVKTINGLRNRYFTMHPMLFQRTIERANSAGEAFDILEGMPVTFPLIWDDHARKWVNPTDMWLDPGRDQ